MLAAAGWFEKFSFYGPQKTDYPYGFVIDKAIEPLGESKGEWEIACLLAKKIQERAKVRGIQTASVVVGMDSLAEYNWQVPEKLDGILRSLEIVYAACVDVLGAK